LKNALALTYFAPHIIRTAKLLGKQRIQSATTVHETDSKPIYFLFAINRIFPPFASLKTLNVIVTIRGLPFQSKHHKGTLKIQVNVYDIEFPQSCKIIIESITCNRGNPSEVNRNAILRGLEKDWEKGFS
jgi:hypothetical protein